VTLRYIWLFTEENVNKKIKRFNFVYVFLTGLRSDVINIIVMCVSAVWRIWGVVHFHTSVTLTLTLTRTLT